MSGNSNPLEEIKLVIAGLDNAGKTSFLIALRKKYNFHEIVKNLIPTIKIDYNSFNFLDRWTINFWDMGGQAKYRKIYINNPIYFMDTNYLFYLIDIQDDLKVEESLNYLKELLKIYRDLNYINEVIICFHKFDPKFKGKDEFSDRVEMIKNLIISQNKDCKFQFFNTSYYDISSLSKAISYSLSKLLNLEEINEKLKNVLEDFSCNHAILYTNSGLIITDYFKESMDIRAFEEMITNKINDNLEFFQRLIDNQVDMDERLTFFEDHMEYVKKFIINLTSGPVIFYLGISTPLKNIKNIKLELEKFYTYLKSSFT